MIASTLYQFGGSDESDREWQLFFGNAFRNIVSAKKAVPLSARLATLIQNYSERKNAAGKAPKITEITSLDVAALYEWCTDAVGATSHQRTDITDAEKERLSTVSLEIVLNLRQLPNYESASEIDNSFSHYLAAKEAVATVGISSKPRIARAQRRIALRAQQASA